MPSEPLFDFSQFDVDHPRFGIAAIREKNPHRHEFEMIDGIVDLLSDPLRAVAVKRVRGDQWWCRGHLPGDPIFPGVLIVEAAAQAASFCFHSEFGSLGDKFFGFGGLEHIRFRGAVRPGDDLILLVRARVVRRRRSIFEFQGWVDQKLVAEGEVIGVTVPKVTTASEAQDA